MPRTLVFCHANGFPAGTYRMLFDRWRQAGWHVIAPEKFGHDARYPVSSNWPHLRDELLDFIRAHTADRPVWLVGHSLGGYLALLAACHRPELVRGLVMLDSPVVGGWRAHSVQVMKATSLMGRVSPGKVSQQAPRALAVRGGGTGALRGQTCLRALGSGGVRRLSRRGFEAAPEGGVQLAFRREVETALYNTLPHHFDRLLHRHPPQGPVAFIGGTQSAEVRQVGLTLTRTVTRGQLRWIDGTHLFPMEQPRATADAVLDQLAAMAGEKSR